MTRHPALLQVALHIILESSCGQSPEDQSYDADMEKAFKHHNRNLANVSTIFIFLGWVGRVSQETSRQLFLRNCQWKSYFLNHSVCIVFTIFMSSNIGYGVEFKFMEGGSCTADISVWSLGVIYAAKKMGLLLEGREKVTCMGTQTQKITTWQKIMIKILRVLRFASLQEIS